MCVGKYREIKLVGREERGELRSRGQGELKVV
jgi:hypothetical protein